MDVHAAIEARRAFRSLDPVPITDALIADLARHAGLAPSCYNNQPWRFVFVDDPGTLEALRTVYSETNRWCWAASLAVVVFSRKDDDCVIRDREYHLFDTGMATAFLILRATELGLVAHPIAGFSPKRTREVLGIPEEFQVITIVLVGRRSESLSPALTEKQREAEARRPERLPLSSFVHRNRYA